MTTDSRHCTTGIANLWVVHCEVVHLEFAASWVQLTAKTGDNLILSYSVNHLLYLKKNITWLEEKRENWNMRGYRFDVLEQIPSLYQGR